ncbi:MAG: cysteine desulfurase-like protein [Planctomyces sp.]|nr:cysteine desulfurase-like protein [Planctomyces sp.]
MPTPFDPAVARDRFPALQRTDRGGPLVYFDGAAGSQCPASVADAVRDYLLAHNANRGNVIVTSVETDERMEAAHRALADFLGVSDPGEIAFGQNMTSLTFALSRALGRTWDVGDEVLVTRLDHDANVTPWMLAARDAGAVVRHVDIHPEDCTLDLDSLRSQLTDRTRLVAVGYASNAVGTINPVREICRLARDAGALSFIDAVHYAPHGQLQAQDLGCDFLACSAYKFFGPHVGVLWGRRSQLETLDAYRLRPAPQDLPGRWMTGTQNHEGICGAAAAVEYVASLGEGTTRVERLGAAWRTLREHEVAIGDRLLRGLRDLPAFRLWGISDSSRWDERVPTFSLTHRERTPRELATALAGRGILTWPGNHYALPLTERLGLEPQGTLRISLLHYNTAEEVDRLLEALRTLAD